MTAKGGRILRHLMYLCITGSSSIDGAFALTPRLPPTFSSRSIERSKYAITLLYVGNKKNNKNLSASNRERRDEEERRRKRKDEVVIGKTSAKKGAKDFSLDPGATEEEYLRQASRVEREVFQKTKEGLDFFNSLQLEKAERAFNGVFEIKPSAYLWQAGIVKYYLGDLEGAAEIFARNAEIYESRFGSPASEERIWRDACELKYLRSIPKKRRQELEKNGDITTIIPSVRNILDSSDIFSIESRRVLKVGRDLFRASVEMDMSEELLARAKLRSLGGTEEEYPSPDRKMWKLSSWFYLGLYNDALGNSSESIKCMKMALKLCPSSGKSDDIVHTLPLLHMTAREWFDDDDFYGEILFDDGDEGKDGAFSPATPNQAVASMAYADPLIENSIREGVSKMKIRELKDALRLQRKKSTGSKEDLQERLFYSLMDDAGLGSGFSP